MTRASAPTTQDATIDDADAPPPGPTTTERTWRSVAPWVVAVVATALAVILAVTLLGQRGDATTRDDVAAVSGRAVSTLTTWDSQSLADVEATVSEFGTGRFQDEARSIFAEFATGLEQAQVTSQGEVVELAVADIVGDRAVALASVRQTITNVSAGAQPVDSCWGARITLMRVNGAWLVDRLALFGPNACDEQAGIDPQG